LGQRTCQVFQAMAVTVGPVLEDHVYRAGLLGLKRALGDGDLLSFPKRPNGTAMLLRQSFFERLLSGGMDLISFPVADIIAAQTDVRNLSVPQLLCIRCSNLDFSASTPSMRTHGEFLRSVDEALERRMAAKLAGRGVNLAPGQVADAVRLVVLVYGVHERLNKEALGSSEHWLVKSGELQALLLLPACELLEVESLGDASAFCHRNLSRASIAVSRAKKQLHWEVELSNPSAFDSAAQPRSPPTRRSRLSTGGRPSLGRCSQEDSPERAPPVDAEVAALIRQRMEEAESSVEGLREDLAAAKASAEEASTRCEELSAAKAEAETATAAANKELKAVRAELESLRERFTALTASEAKAVQSISDMKSKTAEAKDAQAKMALKASGLRQELSFAKEAEQRLEVDVATLREELTAVKKANIELRAQVQTLRADGSAAKVVEDSVVAAATDAAQVSVVQDTTLAFEREAAAPEEAVVLEPKPSTGDEDVAVAATTDAAQDSATQDDIPPLGCKAAASEEAVEPEPTAATRDEDSAAAEAAQDGAARDATPASEREAAAPEEAAEAEPQDATPALESEAAAPEEAVGAEPQATTGDEEVPEAGAAEVCEQPCVEEPEEVKAPSACIASSEPDAEEAAPGLGAEGASTAPGTPSAAATPSATADEEDEAKFGNEGEGVSPGPQSKEVKEDVEAKEKPICDERQAAEFHEEADVKVQN